MLVLPKTDSNIKQLHLTSTCSYCGSKPALILLLLVLDESAIIKASTRYRLLQQNTGLETLKRTYSCSTCDYNILIPVPPLTRELLKRWWVWGHCSPPIRLKTFQTFLKLGFYYALLRGFWI